MKTTNVGCHILVVTTHLLAKAKMCCFIYSLFVQIMYIIVNKATFIVIEILILIFIQVVNLVLFRKQLDMNSCQNSMGILLKEIY